MKKIGIPAWSVGENSFGVTKPYLNFIECSQAIPVLLYPGAPVDPSIDLLLLPGGADVDPARYKKVPKIFTGNPNVHLEYFDINLLPKYIELNIPIFGICRGHQTLNVHFGGSLIQNLLSHEYSSERVEIVHKVRSLHQLPFEAVHEVNSMHHQAVIEPAPGFIALFQHESYKRKKEDPAYSDLSIEAMMHENGRIVSVQWHPEEIFDLFSLKMVEDLLNINDSAHDSDSYLKLIHKKVNKDGKIIKNKQEEKEEKSSLFV